MYSVCNIPNIYDKVVLDIRNKTSNPITTLSMHVIADENFKGEYNSDPIRIPEIKPRERVIVVFDQNKASIPGMKLAFTSNGNTDIINDMLHQDVGSEHIITIDKNHDFVSKEIVNRIIQLDDIFYYKRYNRIINLE